MWRSLLVRTVVVAALVLMAAAIYPRPCLACSCAALTSQEQLAHAVVVFRGTVVAVEEKGTPGSRAYTHATLAVDTVWKGPISQEFVIRGGSGGGDCSVRFEPGQTYVVFADGDPSHVLKTSTCAGTHAISASASRYWDEALGPGMPVPTPTPPGADSPTQPPASLPSPSTSAGDRRWLWSTVIILPGVGLGLLVIGALAWRWRRGA